MRYTPTPDVPPGVNVRRLREAAGLSLRALARACDVPSDHRSLDHTTIRRLERNQGYTQDTLSRVAAALGRALGIRLSAVDLFLPPELADWPELSPEARQRIAAAVSDAAYVARNRRD
jgi:transcriptional regulator with XRE-family HTH domain